MSALQGISGIKVDPKDFEETTKRCVRVCAGGGRRLSWLREAGTHQHGADRV